MSSRLSLPYKFSYHKPTVMPPATAVNTRLIESALPAPVVRLIETLRIKRAHDTTGEGYFVQEFVMPLNPEVLRNAKGEAMAFFVKVGDTNQDTLFTCHVDSVDNIRESDGTSPSRRVIMFDPATGLLHSDGTCILSADDGTGVWTLSEMIKRGVPGHYIFFRGEEVGGDGSQWFATTEQCKQYKRAIALDRKAVYSVITQQLGGACCSDVFGEALAESLSAAIHSDYFFSTDPTGTFTDTAMLMDVIPECTNLSVGYLDQHNCTETQSVPFALAMLEAMCQVDFTTLPTVRNPEPERTYSKWSGYDKGWGDSAWKDWEKEYYDEWDNEQKEYSPSSKTPAKKFLTKIEQYDALVTASQADTYSWVLNTDINASALAIRHLASLYLKEKATSATLDKQLAKAKARLAKLSATVSNLKKEVKHEAETQ